MHSEFEIYDDEVIVRNNNNISEARELTYNIKKILICENNIEEIETLINKKIENVEEAKEKSLSDKGNTLLCMLQGFNCILNLTTERWIIGGLWGLCALLNGGLLTAKYSTKRKKILASKKSIEYLTKELKKEKAKLSVLEKEKNDDFSSFPFNESIQKLKPSEEIRILKNNLLIINDYTEEKRKYINWYKKGILRYKVINYNEQELDYLEQLILLDNPNVEIKEKDQKVKTL